MTRVFELACGFNWLGLVTICITSFSHPALSIQDENEREARLLRPQTIFVVSRRPSPAAEANEELVRYGLTRDDFARFRATLPVQECIPYRMLQIDDDQRQRPSRVCGTTDEWAKYQGLELERGRFLTDADDKTQRSVAVVSAAFAAEQFRQDDPIGKTISLNDLTVTIVGVLKPSEDASATEDEGLVNEANDERDQEALNPHRPDQEVDVFIPITLMMGRLGTESTEVIEGELRRESYELSGVLLQLSNFSQRENMLEVIRETVARRSGGGSDLIVDYRP